MKIKYDKAFMDTIRTEGLTKQEIAEAMNAIEEAAAGVPKPVHLNQNIEAIRNTNLTWYRLKPKHAAYRIVFSLERAKDALIVMGIFRRDDTTYTRINNLFKAITK